MNLINLFSRMHISDFIIGTGDIPKIQITDLNLENEIINMIYSYGFILVFCFIALNLNTFLGAIKNGFIGKLKNTNQNKFFLINPFILIVVLMESIHFGQVFNMPDIALVAFLSGIISQSSINRDQKQFAKK